ncbi:BTAD domain-containing putative transcriptional regulator [Streptomyces hoynatensis]|uniref:SARP family transcriptional regulator n=1 Tax=Streptomyces hoynatensis TaxID=1141874 RepID=A0A3A9YPX6_9ACTN|nr:BTAD domain-containing putative transcriptional regulator [Streptomyces hoynatensis]RKN37524.1 SARP family transcriptional regulator [Streptomyces hoynatensis]
MEFQLLGPFQARHEGRRVLAGSRPQERCLLAVLLLDEGRVVPTERLIDLLWNGSPPASARGTVHTYVGRLRAALAPYGFPLLTRHDGYVAEPGEHTVDAAEFTGLLREAAAAADPGERTRLREAALALWRGPLLADVAGGELRARLGGRLTELRLSALESWAEDTLAMGLQDRVAAELAEPAAAHPERERLVAAQMTALYRTGRAAEALRLYAGTARALRAELGVGPGPALRTLRERIRSHDPRLDRPPGPSYAVRVRDQWLPWQVGGHPALEFCNTYAGWPGEEFPGSEWLREYATLAVWSGYVDLTEDWLVDRLLRQAARDPQEAALVLAEAREFRSRLYACLVDPSDGRAFRAVADLARQAAVHTVLTRGEDGLAGWRLSPAAGLRLPLYATARAAADLLTRPERLTVRACPNPACGWLFLNTSGRRAWCSLGTCGKRQRPCTTGP